MKNQIKKLELNKNLEIEMLEKQLADWKKFNDQLQGTCRKLDTAIEIKSNVIENLEQQNDRLNIELYNLKNMNLFQLILWKLKQ